MKLDRSERTPILEPIILILKQRTGIASIISVLVAVVMLYFQFDIAEIALVLSPIFAFVAKQTLLDSKESSNEVVKEVTEVMNELRDILLLIGLIGDEEEKAEDLEEEVNQAVAEALEKEFRA